MMLNGLPDNGYKCRAVYLFNQIFNINEKLPPETSVLKRELSIKKTRYGKIIFITGASKGFGKHWAETLLQNGLLQALGCYHKVSLPHPEQLLFTEASENNLTHLKGIAPYFENNTDIGDRVYRNVEL